MPTFVPWNASFIFDIAPGTGSPDIHNVNVEIYTSGHTMVANLWFILVMGQTDQWNVDLTLDDYHPYPTVTDNTGSWAGYGGSAYHTYAGCSAPDVVGPGTHYLTFSEDAFGKFSVRFDGLYYDLNVAPLSAATPRAWPPRIVYTTTEGGKTGGAPQTIQEGVQMPQSSVVAFYNDGTQAPTTPYTSSYSNIDFTWISATLTDPVFWHDFHITNELA